MQAPPAKKLGESHLAHGGTEHFEPTDDVTNEVGESIHGIAYLNEGAGPLLVQAVIPGGDGRRGDEESLRRLRQRPATGGSEFEDRHAFDRRIVWPPLSGNAVHPGVLDPCFFYKEGDLLPEPVVLGFQPDSGVDAVRSHAAGEGSGEVGGQKKSDIRWNGTHESLRLRDHRRLRQILQGEQVGDDQPGTEESLNQDTKGSLI